MEKIIFCRFVLISIFKLYRVIANPNGIFDISNLRCEYIYIYIYILQCGSCIRLFHKDLEAYLVAEGLHEEKLTETGKQRLQYI